jgi:hypothetical protein
MYDFNVTGNQNYTDTAQTLYANVTQGTGEVSLYLNGSRSNVTIGNGSSIWVNATLVTGSGNISVYNNDTLVDTGESPINNYSLFSEVSIYNITVFYEGNENYTGDFETWHVNATSVEDIVGPEFTDIANISVYEGDSVYYDINATDQTGVDCFTVNDSNFTIDCDGILTNSSNLSIGTYWLNITVNDTLGFETSEVIYVEVATRPSPRRGGGGPSREEIIEEVIPFDVAPDPLVIDVVIGESDTENIFITNNLGEEIEIVIDFGDFVEFMDIDEAVFTLGIGETKSIDAEVYIPYGTAPDSYIGKIRVKGDGDTKDIETIINVEERPEEALFDIYTSMITRRVAPGSDAKAKIELTNVGNIAATDVTLYYAILDFDNNTISYDQERLSIGKGLTVHRELYLPEEEQDPNYVFYAKVTYPGGIATSADTFTTSALPNWSLFLITILIIIASTITTIILHRRNVALIGQGV